MSRPLGWITVESLDALARGGNSSRGTVPMHVERTRVARLPVYAECKDEALRDRLAMAALPMTHFYQGGGGDWQYDYAAVMAYAMADAMLKARSA